MTLDRTTVQNAQLALLLEVAGTPKPGNVDREHDYPDLHFEQFLAGAVGTYEGFSMIANGEPLGTGFERAIAGMSNQRGGNTQFGAVLLLTPLVAAASQRELTPDGATAIVDATTVEDTVAFYQSFDHVDVAVSEPPEGMAPLDVRYGSEAEAAIREREISLGELMAESASVDGIASEWTSGFARTFEAADALLRRDGPVTERAAAVFLALLASEPDTFVIDKHDRETANEVQQRAEAALEGDENVNDLAEEFIARGINPGTTADIVAGGLFVALERGMEV